MRRAARFMRASEIYEERSATGNRFARETLADITG
jgi:hypothetical protein